LYYHVKIELKEKNKKDDHVKLSELDKVDVNEIIDDVATPYLQDKEFLFDGRILSKPMINSLKIYKTEETSQNLAFMEKHINRNSGFLFSYKRDNIISYDKYSKDITKEILKDITKEEETITKNNNTNKNKVFIVHGHNNEAKLEVARFIEKIDFIPIILHERASNSKTIIEKIENYSDVGFGVVIYTDDDVGAEKSDFKDLNKRVNKRARQNVVFEHGFLMGKLGRSNICSLIKGDIEVPNDISGIVYTSMDSVSWQIELAKEMKASGYEVDMNKL